MQTLEAPLMQKADDAYIKPYLGHCPPLSQIQFSEILRSWLYHMDAKGRAGSVCSHVSLHGACEGMPAATGPDLILLRLACTLLSFRLTARLIHIKLTALKPFDTGRNSC